MRNRKFPCCGLSAYPAVGVKFYEYVNMIADKLTYYLLERKAVAANLQLREGKKPTQDQHSLVPRPHLRGGCVPQGGVWEHANDSFGKGFREVKDHVC